MIGSQASKVSKIILRAPLPQLRLTLVQQQSHFHEVIANIAVNILNINPVVTEERTVVKGMPSIGFDDVPATQPADNVPREVEIVDGYARVIPK